MVNELFPSSDASVSFFIKEISLTSTVSVSFMSIGSFYSDFDNEGNCAG
jgi:hypothetical protein